MNVLQKRRLFFIVLILIVIASAATLALYALQQNINLFFNPTQVAQNLASRGQTFRLGGLVKSGSVKHKEDSLQVTFTVTDNRKDVTVIYIGVLPDLFREGQSVVIDGRLNKNGIFIADQVLAKHDERYMPVSVRKMLRLNEMSTGP